MAIYVCVKTRILESIATQTTLSVGKIRRFALGTARAFHMPRIQRSYRAGAWNHGAETARAVHQATADRIARRVNIRRLGETVSWIGGIVNLTPVFKGERAILYEVKTFLVCVHQITLEKRATKLLL